MSNIVNKSSGKNSNNITSEKKWTRNCPDCNKELLYANIRSYKNAINVGSLCQSCGAVNRPIRTQEFYRKVALANTLLENRIILECYPTLTKQCPSCNKGITYKNKCSLLKSIKNNTLCNSCIQKRDIANGTRKIWSRGQSMTDEFCNKIKLSWARTKFKRCGEHHPYFGKNGPMTGHSHSEETRRKQRIAHIEYLKSKVGNNTFTPNYSKKFCKHLTKVSSDNNIEIIHAENLGEFQFRGYFADGYIPSKNVWIEYDEKKHFFGGKLRDKELLRQAEIEKYLKCKFVRINSNLQYKTIKSILEKNI